MSILFSTQQLIFGIILAIAIGLIGWKAKALSTSGAFGAAVIGSFIFGFGGIAWAVVLLTFFISSTLLSKVFGRKKATLAEKFAKGSQRDWAQTFANGGLGVFLVVIQLLFPNEVLIWLAYAGAMATVNADTWATELGVLSPKLPRLITNGKQVPTGTSGGITFIGTLATTVGGALIGLTAWFFTPSYPFGVFVGAVTLAGLTGSLIDSFLGATVQAIFYDPARQKETERRIILEDGTPAAPIRGFDWMNNDMVNFLASLGGALTAILAWNLLVS